MPLDFNPDAAEIARGVGNKSPIVADAKISQSAGLPFREKSFDFFISDNFGVSDAKIIKVAKTGHRIEMDRFGPYDDDEYTVNPDLKYLVQHLILVDANGNLLKEGEWKAAIAGNSVPELVRYMTIQRKEKNCCATICRLIDTSTGQVLHQYDDLPEKDEKRRQNIYKRFVAN